MGRLASSESVPVLLQHQRRRRKEPWDVGWSCRLQAQEHKGKALSAARENGASLCDQVWIRQSASTGTSPVSWCPSVLKC